MNISLRKSKSTDFDFALQAKKQAMGPHIEAKWGWNEEYQLEIHRQRWAEKCWFIINLDGNPVGTLSLDKIGTSILRLGEFYLLDEYRNRGIGTYVLEGILAESDEKGENVILEYLKWNPVGSLYKRYGFTKTAESDIHYFMERRANYKQ